MQSIVRASTSRTTLSTNLVTRAASSAAAAAKRGFQSSAATRSTNMDESNINRHHYNINDAHDEEHDPIYDVNGKRRQHILHHQRKGRKIFLDEKHLIDNSIYPAEYPAEYVPVPTPEVPSTKGRRILGTLYDKFMEFYNGHRSMVFFNKSFPQTFRSVWVAPSATVVGDVWLNDFTNVWYGAVLRGDKNRIELGGYTNIQDGAVITTDDKPTSHGFDSSVVIGNYVTVGHGAKLHACRVGNRSIIGMGAVVLEGAVIEEDCIVAAGSVVPPNRRIPAKEMWAGNPARFVRKVGTNEADPFESDAIAYHDLALQHDLQYTDVGMAYKEVEKIIEDVEIRSPMTDERPIYWNVWDEMSKEGKSPYPTGKRELD